MAERTEEFTVLKSVLLAKMKAIPPTQFKVRLKEFINCPLRLTQKIRFRQVDSRKKIVRLLLGT